MSRLFILGPVLGACLLVSAPAFAQETPPSTPPPAPIITPEVSTEPEMALDELIRRALANSPQLSIARENGEAARARISAARSNPGPTLEIVPGIGNREARDEEIVLSQPLDLFGKRRARAGVFAAEARRAEAQNTLAERSLVIAVKNAAAELFAAQEAESLGAVQVEVARLFRDAAARRAALGDVPPVQVQRAELELLRIQNEQAGAQAGRLERRAALNGLIGQAPETPLRVSLPNSAVLSGVLQLRSGASQASSDGGANAATLQTPSPAASPATSFDLATLRARVLPSLATRPDILGAQATVEARRASVESLRRERRPDI
ncbi:MAG TPA: TolC family protein, partial [Abditibacteriaceae bacterium]